MEKNKDLSIYVHFPFCKSKCPYCDFNSTAQNFDEIKLLDAYISELNYFYKKTSDKEIKTIFFGGGTPSLMSPKTIETLLFTISQLWNIINLKNIEISMEANPTSIENDKIRDFKSAGINRFSIGVQALNDRDLKALGRQHNTVEAKKAIEVAQKHFGKHYSIDLIYTRPKQKLSDWVKELEEAVKLSPYHLSLYQLTLEEGTLFSKMSESGKIKMPDEESSIKFYEETNNFMESVSINQYEVSNYAKLGFECKHNLNYWNSGEYIGIGAGAHSRVCLGNIITENYKLRTAIEMGKNPQEWMEMARERNVGLCHAVNLEKKEFIEEFLLMGLRLAKGIGNKELSKYVGTNLFNILDKNKLQKCVENELIEVETKNQSIKATKKGLLLLNTTIQELL